MDECKSETKRIEAFWAGTFGDEYVSRNINAAQGRRLFWKKVLASLPINSVLEVGCNIGANLHWIAQKIDKNQVYGVDINQEALNVLRHSIPNVNAVWAQARYLPFRDQFFDFVFTTGVLIHQSPETLKEVMSEIVRCSRRYILCGEYYAPTLTEIPYRGHSGVLFKQDYGALYQKMFPTLHLLEKGFLPRERGGWDDVTYWIFEKKTD